MWDVLNLLRFSYNLLNNYYETLSFYSPFFRRFSDTCVYGLLSATACKPGALCQTTSIARLKSLRANPFENCLTLRIFHSLPIFFHVGYKFWWEKSFLLAGTFQKLPIFLLKLRRNDPNKFFFIPLQILIYDFD